MKRNRSKKRKISAAGREEAELLAYYCRTHIRHAGNKPRYYGTPFILEDWQWENIWLPIFGTGKIEDGGFVRAYRTALVGLPRDYGKTELICAMLLTEANMNPVRMGQYGIVAYSKEQAQKILATLGDMIGQDDDLRNLWDRNKNEIVNRETRAVIKVFPYSEAALQSWHFNVLVADELHVWKSASVYSAIRSGMAHVENSLLLAITTASEARSGFLWDWINGNPAEGVRSILDDPSAYMWWHGANDSDNIESERVWERLALPSWVTVGSIRAMRESMRYRDFERYTMNRFPLEKGLDRSMRQVDIAACRKAGGFDFDQPFTLAIDGAVRGDAFALVAHQIGEDGHHLFAEWVYDTPPADRGYYDVGAIGQLVAGLCQKYRCPVGIDPARLLLWANELKDTYGCEIYEIRQSNEVMCPACALVVNAVRSRTANLRDCPKLSEHLANCRDMRREPWGYRFTADAHGQGSDRIDAAIAAAMAMWMTEVMPERVESFAESGGIWTL